MDLQVRADNGTQKINVVLKESTKELVSIALNGVFSFLGVATEEGTSLAQLIINPEPVEYKQKSRRLPIQRTEDPLIVPIGEHLGVIHPQDEDHNPVESVEIEDQVKYYSGIKRKPDGTPLYQCRYICTCGNRGKRYIPEGAEVVYCHQCNTKLKVRLAVPEQPGVQDEWNNFYMADEPVDTD